MRMLVLLLIILDPPSAFGRADQDVFRAVARAKSAAEVHRVLEDFEELKISRAACRLQIKKKQVPLACYESLFLEIKKGLHPRSIDRIRLSARLDELCAESAQRFQMPREFPRSVAVSTQCRKYINDANDIRRYRENNPTWSDN
jgi:hypothetical protein